MFEQLEKYLSERAIFSTSELERISSKFDFEKVSRNSILLGFEDVSQHYYFINSGCLRLFTINNDGIETSRYFAFENMFCTALPSFIDQKPACEYMEAIEKSELLKISRVDFYKLVNEFSQFDKIYREILELGFITAQQRIYGFQGFNALEKVKWVIKNQPTFLLRVSNKMAASYLGISPATLSRTKAKL
ncbi:cAMP-binding protein [Aequorivita sublithincola DSM 14238]|uniref:cAMP-binding protein n=1 Tax=Aequorivita sublithincola (strain DSM 14238 / LMG 21431 / ACAM 643 / 9-3) TaxID=746697 RepID=I3YRL0_AEQSU|nr:Crp/Fnr family transcriptional regulator [Aequorivita sublithincola]AFL79628.1 cAMP-binding protein [Aequorivita sublithincola DSM 14238]